ncbi:hypothetical protein BMF89_06010 [Arthrobacter sp. SRS-W-1-2016]|nr:hypothetical protein BMF89_06010 [Arthrobacter sp. SRS-W-1-2016]
MELQATNDIDDIDFRKFIDIDDTGLLYCCKAGHNGPLEGRSEFPFQTTRIDSDSASMVWQQGFSTVE